MMTPTLNPVMEQPLTPLKACLALSEDVTAHDRATEQFQELRETIATDSAQAQEVLDQLWFELLRARRSALFWQKTSDVERELTERMAASHLQLQQNYLRLVQEQ